jgi:hypothetical protein
MGKANDPGDLFERLTHELAKLDAKMAGVIWDIGTRLVAIHEQELWRPAHESFDAYLADAVGLSSRRARSYTRVAGLDLMLRYAKTLPAHELPADLTQLTIRFGSATGRSLEKRLGEATCSEIIEALEALGLPGRRTQPFPASAIHMAKTLEAALPPAPPGTAARVRLRRTRGGEIIVDFDAIPVENLPEFARALQEHSPKD